MLIIDDSPLVESGKYRWETPDGQITLWLDMSEPRHPWRTAINGKVLLSKWSTPFVAMRRTKQRMPEDALAVAKENNNPQVR